MSIIWLDSRLLFSPDRVQERFGLDFRLKVSVWYAASSILDSTRTPTLFIFLFGERLELVLDDGNDDVTDDDEDDVTNDDEEGFFILTS